MANLFVDVVMRAGRDEAPFLHVPDGEVLTYEQMRVRAAKVAAALAAIGVAPGDRVAAQIEKSAEGLMLYLGTLFAGAVFLPLNTAYTTPELTYFLADAEPRLVVCDPSRRDAIAGIAGGAVVETLDADGGGSFHARTMDASAGPPVDRKAEDLAAILYTSGTTGRSKGAMLSHGNLVSNAEALVAAWRFTPADRLIHALPIYHIHGLFVACNVAMLSGSSMTFMPKFDVDKILDAMPDTTTMMGVPTFYTRLLAHPGLTEDRTKRIRLFVSGSAPLLAETHRAWSERTGHAILERYGMTETNMNTSNPYDGERRPGTVGFPLPGVDARVVDPATGIALDRDEIGMIEIKGPNVFQGYWRNAEKTAEEFRPDGFFITGDLGKIDGDGYVHILGRSKDLVISGGFNVYPREIETEIDVIDGVVESAVIGLPHADLGEAVTAVVVRRDGAEIDEARIKTALSETLAKFKLPKRILFAGELPRNAMGKVQKNALRDQYKAIYEA